MSSPARALPGVTVAISSYNYASYLGETIESALSQEGVDLEVVIVDDASKDDSVAIARSYAARDSRVRVIAHEQNKGHIATFNEALWAGTRDYVVKLDSDDLLTPGALATAARVLDDHPSVGMVYGRAIVFRDKPAAAAGLSKRVDVWGGARWIALRCRKATNVIFQPEVMVRRSVLVQTDGHSSRIPAAHDLNLWLRLAALADVAYVYADLGCYREHDDSLLHSVYSGYLSDLRQRRLAFDDFFETMSAADGRRLRVDRLADRVHRKLAVQAVEFATRACAAGRAEESDLADYLRFADEVWPQVRGTADWRMWSKVSADGSSGLLSRVLSTAGEFSYSVRDAVKWRYWRRYGV